VFSPLVTSVGNWFIASKFQHTKPGNTFHCISMSRQEDRNSLLKNQLVTGKQAKAHYQESSYVISQRGSGEGVGVSVAGRESVKDGKQEGIALVPFNFDNGTQVNVNGDHPGEIGNHRG